MDNLLTINQAAELISVHPETLRRWDRDGTLIAIKVNERGDRRYKKSDILEFMKSNPGLVQYGDIISYGGYSIKWDTEGFLSMPASFGLVARFIVYNDENPFIGFAFAVAGLSLFGKEKEESLDELAINKIKEYIDHQNMNDRDIFTFEYFTNDFLEVQNPEWWKEKYSKSLTPGLRIEVHSTQPTTTLLKAWRVILQFKCKQNGQWIVNTFGPNNIFTEYYVWIDSKELSINTANIAEILAIKYAKKRFEETKDENADRDISRINENKVACYEGKYIKDGLLPEEIN